MRFSANERAFKNEGSEGISREANINLAPRNSKSDDDSCVLYLRVKRFFFYRSPLNLKI